LNILLIGLGSIGKRHLRNIIGLGYGDISVVSRAGILPQEFEGFTTYTTIEAALSSSGFDAAIICTPTSKHITAVKSLLNAGVRNIYVEKPISDSLEEIETLPEFLPDLNLNIVVGFDLHFDLGLQKVKELLENGKIGKVVSVNAQVGQYLPDWRPYEDYRKGMSARKEAGGGVMLDLIHEFDYLYWLFGKIDTIAALCKNSGALEIETEDVAEVLLKFQSGVIGTIHLDYLQQKLIRNCVITGFNGTITWNLVDSKVTLLDKNKNEDAFEYKHFERNDRFVAIMKAFLDGGTDERLTSFSNGIESLKMVEAAKKSSETQQFVSLNSLNLLPA
jgi:predicted dehydrogenase